MSKNVFTDLETIINLLKDKVHCLADCKFMPFEFRNKLDREINSLLRKYRKLRTYLKNFLQEDFTDYIKQYDISAVTLTKQFLYYRDVRVIWVP